MLTPALLLLSVALGSDVLVPAFTPRTVSDLSAADFMTNEALLALRRAGLDVADPEILVARAGEAARGCADEARCPGNLWGNFPEAKVAVVGVARATAGGLQVEVQLYRPDQRTPVEVIQMSVADGAEAAFSARMTERVQSWVAIPLEPPPEPPPPPPAPAPVPAPAPLDAYTILDPYTGQPVVVVPRDANPVTYPYTYEIVKPQAAVPAAPVPEPEPEPLTRGGSSGIELYLGPTFGDVDRRYDVRAVIVEDGDSRTLDADPYQYETWRGSAGFIAGVQLTHAPLAWVEGTLGVGMQLGHIELSTGWEIQDTDGDLVEAEHDPLQTGSSLTLVVEPGLRGYPVPDAVVSPYVMARLSSRFRGPIQVPESHGIDWPDARSGLDLGGTFGLGIASGSGEHLMLFLEVPWTVWLTAGSERRGGSALLNVPPQASPVGQSLELRAGVGWRF